MTLVALVASTLGTPIKKGMASPFRWIPKCHETDSLHGQVTQRPNGMSAPRYVFLKIMAPAPADDAIAWEFTNLSEFRGFGV